MGRKDYTGKESKEEKKIRKRGCTWHKKKARGGNKETVKQNIVGEVKARGGTIEFEEGV